MANITSCSCSSYTNTNTYTGSQCYNTTEITNTGILYPATDHTYIYPCVSLENQTYLDQLEKLLKQTTAMSVIPNYIEKDNNKMETYNFGPYNTTNIRMSIYGMAIKAKDGKWVSYDKEKKTLMNVNVLNFDINSNKMFYIIPKAFNAIAPGDIILHNDKPVFVEKVRDDNKFEVINPYEGTAEIILLAKSPFGFEYASQIVCLMDVLPEASAENPFGSFLPFILGGDNSNIPLIMAMTDRSFDDLDPMMMMMLCGKGDMSTYFLMQMLTKKKNKKEKQKRLVKQFNDVYQKNRHAIYGPGVEDIDE